MPKIAVIKTGGKQYKVSKGDKIKVEKIGKKQDSSVKFTTLMTSASDGKELKLGKPSLGEIVEGKILEEGKDKKVNVVKYKNKTRYLRNKGHRQLFTKVEITKIS